MKQVGTKAGYHLTALTLYLSYFVYGVAVTILGQYKQEFAALWEAPVQPGGGRDVSGVLEVLAAIGLGRLAALPVAGPLSDRLGRKLCSVLGCALYAVFLLALPFVPSLYLGYALAIVSGMANSFLDTGALPSCMEIFRERGTIANLFIKMSISLAQFLLPFATGMAAAWKMPFHLIFVAVGCLAAGNGLCMALLPFPAMGPDSVRPSREKRVLKITPALLLLAGLGFTTSTTFMLWLNCNQELGRLYGMEETGWLQSVYSVGIVLALLVSALLLRCRVSVTRILIAYPAVSLVTLLGLWLVRTPAACLIGSFLLGFFAAGGVLQLVTALANRMFPQNRGTVTSVVMATSSLANYVMLTAAGRLSSAGGAEGPRLVLLLNMGVTALSILLAICLAGLAGTEKQS